MNDRGAEFISNPEIEGMAAIRMKGETAEGTWPSGGGFLGRRRICAVLSPGWSAIEHKRDDAENNLDTMNVFRRRVRGIFFYDFSRRHI